MAASLCRLSCCHFPGMRCLTSDIESTGDVIPTIKSFPSVIMQTEVVICLVVLLPSSSDFLSGQGTFAYHEQDRTQMSRSPLARYLQISSMRQRSLYLANISRHKICLCWLGHVVWHRLPSGQVTQHLSPNVLASFQEPGRYHWWDCGRIYQNLWVHYTFWHVASFNVAKASFGSFTPLRHSHYHNSAFGFPCNRRFYCKVLRLEGGHFKFWESRPLIL